VTRPPAADPPAESEPPGVPGFRTWNSVYLFVIGWFVLLVALLAAFSWFFS
jgi:hypothetical protein